MDRMLNVATPLIALTVDVPLKVPLPGFAAMANVTLDESPVTRLLNRSSTCTVIAGLIDWPAIVLVGCCKKARWLVEAAAMLKAVEVAPVRLPSAAIRV